jgi:hypothetical protein
MDETGAPQSIFDHSTGGFATAPVEGVDPAGVRAEFGIPEAAEVIARLAIRRANMASLSAWEDV